MKLITTVQKGCLLSAHEHLFKIKEDLCGSAGPLNNKHEEVMNILTEAWDKITAL